MTDSGGHTKVLFGKYELGRLLGCGAFAKVFHARNIQTGGSVAVKVIAKHHLAAHRDLAENVMREIAIMRRLRHPHVVQLLEVLASRTRIYLVVEFLKGGDLFSRIAAGGRLPEGRARRYFRQLISAVAHCHARGVFHRDLKPENLLFDDCDNLKVSDFGLGALLDAEHNGGQVLHTLCGTPAFVAPEVLAQKGYDGAKVDVWSCGVILFVLVAGYLPFNDHNVMRLYRKICKGEYWCPRWTSLELRRLLSRLLDTNPETRITVDEITRDPWFRRGLSDEELAAVTRSHCVADEETDDKREEKRELNAFDIIGFSSGIDLSGLVGSAPDLVRFVSTGPVEEVLRRAEAVGREEGLVVRRKKGLNEVALEEQNGNFVARVEVYRLRGLLVVVVVEVERGGGEAGQRWSVEFWRDRLGLGGDRLPPVANMS